MSEAWNSGCPSWARHSGKQPLFQQARQGAMGFDMGGIDNEPVWLAELTGEVGKNASKTPMRLQLNLLYRVYGEQCAQSIACFASNDYVGVNAGGEVTTYVGQAIVLARAGQSVLRSGTHFSWRVPSYELASRCAAGNSHKHGT